MKKEWTAPGIADLDMKETAASGRNPLAADGNWKEGVNWPGTWYPDPEDS